MLIKLIRNEAKGNAITGRLVIDGKWLCDTLERKGYEILALCYHMQVTMSPKFKRLLPLVTGVPRTPQSGYGTATPMGRADSAIGYRQGIRIHRGSKPEHSTGCILVRGDSNLQQPQQHNSTTYCAQNNTLRAQGEKTTPTVGARTSADVENELTQLLLKAQNTHEEIILEVSDFKPGTEYGYNTKCPPELQNN